MLPLASAGYRVVAPDQRGFGHTKSINDGDKPVQFDDPLLPYRTTNLVHDIVALAYGLGHTSVTAIVGHDFGSAVAAHCALIRPDLFKTAICMSAPFTGAPTLPSAVDASSEGSSPRTPQTAPLPPVPCCK